MSIFQTFVPQYIIFYLHIIQTGIFLYKFLRDVTILYQKFKGKHIQVDKMK